MPGSLPLHPIHYRREIDGLRAVAVIPVILFHANWSVFGGGYVGVDVFFVISGYLITSLILKERAEGNFSLLRFYERRARRILPALFLVMAVSIVPAWLWMFPEEFRDFGQSLVATIFFLSNVLFWLESGYFDHAAELKPLLHTWSLCIEEQYYIFFPLCIMVLWFLGKRKLLFIIGILALVSFAVSGYTVNRYPEANFFLIPTRAWELLIGSMLAFDDINRPLHRRMSRAARELLSLLGLGMILFAIFAYDAATPFPGVHALVPTLGTSLVIAFARPGTLVGRMLSAGLLVGIGLISYSAYLWHYPLFVFARIRLLNEPSLEVYAILIVLTFAAAILTWHFVEVPFRNRQRVPIGQICVAGTGGAFLLGIFGLFVHLNQGFEGRFAPEVIKLAYRGDRSVACESMESCLIGDPTAATVSVALVGDSHADSLSHALSLELQRLNMAARQMTYPGCPPVIGLRRLDMNLERYNHGVSCSSYYEEVLDFIEKDPDVQVVILAARWTLYLERERFDNQAGGRESGRPVVMAPIGAVRRVTRNRDALRGLIGERYGETIARLLRSGKKILIVYPVPEVGWDVPLFLAKQKRFLEKIKYKSTSYDLFKTRNTLSYQVLDQIMHPNIYRVIPERIMCQKNNDECFFINNNEVFYIDTNHLNDIGANLIVKEIGIKLRYEIW